MTRHIILSKTPCDSSGGRKGRRPAWRTNVGVAVALLLAGSRSLYAQEISETGVTGGGGEGAAEVTVAGPVSGALFPRTGLPGLEPPQPLPAGVTLDFGAGVMYDDNIYRVSENERSATALQADAGIRWTRDQSGVLSASLGYRARGSTYLDLDGQDGVDQYVEAEADLSLPRTRFGFSAEYGYLTGAGQSLGGGGRGGRRFTVEQAAIDDADREVGPLEDRQKLNMSMEVERKLAERTGMIAGIHYEMDDYEEEDRQATKSLTGRLETDYAFTDFTRFGLAGEITSRSTDRTADMTTERILLTAKRIVSERVDFRGEAGVSFRQYGGADAVEDDTGFVFRLNYSQRIGERSAFNLSAFRDTGSSATTRAASVERTGFTASLSHQLTQRVSLGLQGGYDFSSYGSTRATVTGMDREENFWNGNVSVSYAPTQRISLSLYYSYRNQDSASGGDGDGLSYDSNQVGVRAGIRF